MAITNITINSRYICQNCEKACGITDFCSFACRVAHLEFRGYKVVSPNNICPCSFSSNFVAREHEHAEHPDYKHPVKVTYVGEHIPDPWMEENFGPLDLDFWDQTHALLYTDGCVALTMYERNHFLWTLSTGKCLCGISGYEHFLIDPQLKVHDPYGELDIPQET